jgi:RimJ/RimL family protein N-acetyltransferase
MKYSPATIHNHAPVIDAERLRLRPHATSDFDLCVRMWADPSVTQFTIGTASPAPRTWQRILAYRGHWALLGFGYWAVEEKSSGQFIGELGFADFKRGPHYPINGVPELGWALIPSAWGKGYATEGLKAAVMWGDSHFNELATACIIRSENLVSFRVAAKIGYRESSRVTVDGATNVILYRRRTPR